MKILWWQWRLLFWWQRNELGERSQRDTTEILFSEFPSQTVMAMRLNNTATEYVLSCVRLFAIPWTIARQAPLFMGFSRQEYWSGFPFPPLGDPPDPGIEPTSLVSPALAGNSWPLCHLGSPMRLKSILKCECIVNRTVAKWFHLNLCGPRVWAHK